jgi:predicted molibdopterin-dependent oxidoreductase YjgC
MIRLVPDQSGLIARTDLVTFTFDGQSFVGHSGETVLSALIRGGVRHLRDAPTDGAPRGAFCCMGLCQECVVQVGGVHIESCRQIVSGGLAVESLRRTADV